MRFVLITSSGCVRNEAMAPAVPVHRNLRDELSSTLRVPGIVVFNFKKFPKM